MKKKVLAVLLTAAMASSILAGCGSKEAETAAQTESAAAGVSYTIGISQFAEHGSLDNCKEGFLEGLEEAGIKEGENLTIVFENAQTDSQHDCGQLCVEKGGSDLCNCHAKRYERIQQLYGYGYSGHLYGGF